MRKFGLIIFFMSIGLLAGIVLFDIIRDTLLSGFLFSLVGIGFLGIFLGLIIMLASLIFERIRDSKEENYDVNDNK